MEGGFGLPYTIKGADGEPIKVGSASAPCVADWDSDGDPDLLVGTGDGGVDLYRNISTDSDPSLGPRIGVGEGKFPAYIAAVASGAGRATRVPTDVVGFLKDFS